MLNFHPDPRRSSLVLEGYLPREFKAKLTSKELFKPPPVALAKPLPLYAGTIQVELAKAATFPLQLNSVQI